MTLLWFQETALGCARVSGLLALFACLCHFRCLECPFPLCLWPTINLSSKSNRISSQKPPSRPPGRITSPSCSACLTHLQCVAVLSTGPTHSTPLTCADMDWGAGKMEKLSLHSGNSRDVNHNSPGKRSQQRKKAFPQIKIFFSA